jgi:hypothetical protein
MPSKRFYSFLALILGAFVDMGLWLWLVDIMALGVVVEVG